MDHSRDSTFLQHVNAHIGIARKVSRVYSDDGWQQDDLFQEMMYQLWKSYPRFKGDSTFSTWMYKVCLNTAMTFRKNATRHKARSVPLEDLDVAETIKSIDPVEELYAAIATLERLNKAIILLYLDDLSYEEIASVTGLTKSNVSVRLVRIKKELENILRTKDNPETYVNH
jgi:RNA polymerase sigma factor (sigma-70 family)